MSELYYVVKEGTNEKVFPEKGKNPIKIKEEFAQEKFEDLQDKFEKYFKIELISVDDYEAEYGEDLDRKVYLPPNRDDHHGCNTE